MSKHIHILTLNPREHDDKERIRSAWSLLRERLDELTLQTDPDWFWPNMEYFSPQENKLCFILISYGNSPLALIPLEQRRVTIGPISFKALGFIYHPATPANSAILVDNCDASISIWDAFVAYLLSKQGWHCLSLEGLATTSAIAMELIKRLQGHQKLIERLPTPSLFLELTGDGESFLRSRQRSYRKNINRTRRNLEKLGKVEFVSEKELKKPPLELLIDIDRQSWRMNKPEDIIKNQSFLDYIYRLNNTFDCKGTHIFRFLLLNGVPVASHYSFRYGNVLYMIKNAFSEEFRSIGSPGLLLLHEIIKESFTGSVARIEFQAENWYITRISSQQHYLSKDLLFNENGIGSIAGPILNLIKKLRDRITKVNHE